MKGLIRLAGCLMFLFAGQAMAGSTYLANFDVPADAAYVGSEDCVGCHEEIGAFYASSPHHYERGWPCPAPTS
ncbi:MAG: hypothetical protein R3D98_11555 [Candidatus Krumholzibacteriia bacterium]